MSRKTVRTKVDRVNWKDYKKVAESFFGGAEVAFEYEYWNAAGVLIVHSAIAYADSISIKLAGVKSQGEDHNQTVTLLKELLAVTDENKKAFTHLEKIIAHKTSVSYSGDVYDRKDVESLWKNFERFKRWAESLLKD
ncbi:MAG: HEPN domain-containing protein [Ignavibacteriaceae bacterium]|nr:HEPN domain-containing protein [Ignavibacteriaceae bacterium]